MNDDVVLPRLWWCTCRVNVLNDGQRAQRALWGESIRKASIYGQECEGSARLFELRLHHARCYLRKKGKDFQIWRGSISFEFSNFR